MDSPKTEVEEKGGRPEYSFKTSPVSSEGSGESRLRVKGLVVF